MGPGRHLNRRLGIHRIHKVELDPYSLGAAVTGTIVVTEQNMQRCNVWVSFAVLNRSTEAVLIIHAEHEHP